MLVTNILDTLFAEVILFRFRISGDFFLKTFLPVFFILTTPYWNTKCTLGYPELPAFKIKVRNKVTERGQHKGKLEITGAMLLSCTC